MKEGISMSQFHEELAKELLPNPPSEEDVLCLMLLLHACRIALSTEAKVEGGGSGFAAITSRHVARVAATLFANGPRANPEYWYQKWNGEWDAYAILESVPGTMVPGLRRMQEMIESHPWIDKLEDEDWSILSECAGPGAP